MELKLNAKSKAVNAPVDFRLRLKRLRDKRASNLSILIPGVRHSQLAKSDLLNLDSLSFSRKDFKIISYAVLTSKNREVMVSKNVLGAEVKAIFKELETDDVVFFEDIKIEGTDGVIRTFNSIRLRIVDI
jgi:orotidine-5'-phosphate decarboxylase